MGFLRVLKEMLWERTENSGQCRKCHLVFSARRRVKLEKKGEKAALLWLQLHF